VDVRRVAEQEAAPVAEALGGAVMDAVGREPAALPEGEAGPPPARSTGTPRRTSVVALAQLLGQDADHAPAVLAAHRKEQVEAVAPQIDVELVRPIAPVASVSATKNVCS
jgi:hypothetical protein